VCAQGHVIELADLPAIFLEVHDSGTVDSPMRLAARGEVSQEILADLDGVPLRSRLRTK